MPAASTVHLPPGSWATVLDCLCDRFPTVSREQWQSRIERGKVLDAEQRPIAIDHPYRAGLRLHYFREVADEARIPVEESVLHADDHLVVADKPHFLPVIPGGGYVDETLLHRLVRRLGNPELAPLHRIDRATAGLVLLSANRTSRHAYHSLFSERRIGKRYQCLAPALPGLELPLVRRTRMVDGEPFFRMCEADGEPNSETRIDVLDRDAGPGLWRYALWPVTGRKHQLRVHMAGLGAPIVNDLFYPDLAPVGPDDLERPLALLADQIWFDDPLSGEPRRFESRLTLAAPTTDRRR